MITQIIITTTFLFFIMILSVDVIFTRGVL